MTSPIKTLVCLRGVSGSGKSTLAKILTFGHPHGVSFSTDEFFVGPDGIYRFDPTLLTPAHAWNLQRAKHAMQRSIPLVVVDNTNIELWEFKPYCELAVLHGYAISFQEPKTPWWAARDVSTLARRNIHNIDQDRISAMLLRWNKSLPTADWTVELVLASSRPKPLYKKPYDNQNGERASWGIPSHSNTDNSQSFRHSQSSPQTRNGLSSRGDRSDNWRRDNRGQKEEGGRY